MKQKLLLFAFASLLSTSGVLAQITGEDGLYEVAITAENATAGTYTISESTDYTYLVIVPTKPYMGENAVSYGISDGTNKVGGHWGFAWGGWQQNRASVLKIGGETTKMYANYEETEISNNDFTVALATSSIDFKNLKELYVTNGGGDDAITSHELSAIYFTNEKPHYENRYNYRDADYYREIATNGTWGTICLPYNSAICGAYAYEVAGVDSKENPTKLYLNRVYGLLKAGKAYIFQTNTALKANADNYGFDNGGGVFFYKAGATTKEAATDEALVGNLSADNKYVAGADKYIMQGGVWKKAPEEENSQTCWVGQYKAYLDMSKVEEYTAEGASAKGFIVAGVEGETTGINSAKAEQTESDVIYNLNGARVSNPQKGIYIKNGKKFVVK